ncbi:MAG: MATE family efflux transporter [Planctomycetota bacterium]
MPSPTRTGSSDGAPSDADERRLAERRELRAKILHLALPLIGANFAQTALSVTDTAMVGRLGAKQLAAMGPPNVFFLVLFLTTSATFMGVQALTARRFGEDRPQECGKILDNGLVLAFAIGIGAGLLGLFLAPPLCSLLVRDPEVARLSSEYLIVRWGGVVTLTTLWVLKGYYFGLGITRIDLWISLGMNLVNIFLNWVLLFGNLGSPAFGLAGAAWASVASTGMAAIIYLWHASGAARRERFGHLRLAGIETERMMAIVRLSAPRAMAGLAFGGSILFFKLIADHASEAGLAASTAIWRFTGVAVLASIAIGSAAASLVGHELGAGRPERAEVVAREATRIGMMISAAIGLVVVAMPDLVMRIFSEDPAVISAGAPGLRLIAVFLFVDAGGIILARVLSSAGCVLYVMTMEFLVSLVLMLGAAFYLVRHHPDNLAAVWLSWAVYMVGWYLAMALKFGAGGWKRVRI